MADRPESACPGWCCAAFREEQITNQWKAYDAPNPPPKLV